MASQLNEGITIKDLLKRIDQYKAKALKGRFDIDPPHGESLVKTLLSAYDSLPEKAKILFELMSYFPTGIEKDNLDKIMEGSSEDSLAQLMDVSLVEISENNRYGLLPSVRLFSQYVLRNEIKEEYESEILKFKADYSKIIIQNYFSEEAISFKPLFMMEEPNFRYAAENIKEEVFEDNDHSLKVVLSDNLLKLYNYSDRIDEGLTFGDKMLIQFKAIGPKLGEANTLFYLGILRVRKSKLEEAEQNYLQCLEMYKEINHKLGEAGTLRSMGDLSVINDKLEDAEQKYKKCLEMFKDIGDKLSEAYTMTNLARLWVLKEDVSNVKNYLDEAKKIYTGIEENDGIADICEIKMLIYLIQQKASESKYEIEECLMIKRKTENYSETLSWLLFYAKYLNKKELSKEANLCLEYANKIAKQAKSQDLNEIIAKFSFE